MLLITTKKNNSGLYLFLKTNNKTQHNHCLLAPLQMRSFDVFYGFNSILFSVLINRMRKARTNPEYFF